MGPCGKSWFLALPTHQDSREIRCRRKGHPSFMAPTSGHLFRESVSVLSGTQSLWTGQRWSTREDPSRDKALPGPTPHLLRASFSQTSNEPEHPTQNARRRNPSEDSDSLSRLIPSPTSPSPHLRLALSLAELEAGLFPPRLSQSNFLNCMKTENKQKTKSTKA